MKKLLISIILTILLIASPASAEFLSDVIVTSPNGIWTDSRAYADLQAAITAVGVNERTIKIVSPQVVTALTVPSTVTLEFERDGTIANSGYLDIQTKKIIAPNRTVFTGSGNIDFADGSVLRTAWFNSTEASFAKTVNDVVTLIISKPQILTGSFSPGNDVTLKWESPGNILTINPGVTVGNLKNIEAGNYQLFAGAGDFDFLDGSELKLNWFNRLSNVLTWVENEEVTIIVNEDSLVQASVAAAANENIRIIPGGKLSVPAGVTLTLNGSVDASLDAFDLNTTASLIINGAFEAGLYRAFSGTGSIVFGGGAIREVHSRWFYSGMGDWDSAINLAALSIDVSKGTILLPIGTCVVGNTLTIGTDITLKGDKKHNTILDASALWVIGNGTSMISATSARFENLSISGPATTPQTYPEYGIYMPSSGALVLHDVRIAGFSTTGLHVDGILHAFHLRIANCGVNGIFIGGGDSEIHGLELSGIGPQPKTVLAWDAAPTQGVGIFVRSGGNFQIYGGIIGSCNYAGIKIGTGALATNGFDGFEMFGGQIDNCRHAVIGENTFTNHIVFNGVNFWQASPTSPGSSGINCDGVNLTNVGNVKIVNSYFSGIPNNAGNGYGISLDTVKQFKIMNNQFYDDANGFHSYWNLGHGIILTDCEYGTVGYNDFKRLGWGGGAGSSQTVFPLTIDGGDEIMVKGNLVDAADNVARGRSFLHVNSPTNTYYLFNVLNNLDTGAANIPTDAATVFGNETDATASNLRMGALSNRYEYKTDTTWPRGNPLTQVRYSTKSFSPTGAAQNVFVDLFTISLNASGGAWGAFDIWAVCGESTFDKAMACKFRVYVDRYANAAATVASVSVIEEHDPNAFYGVITVNVNIVDGGVGFNDTATVQIKTVTTPDGNNQNWFAVVEYKLVGIQVQFQ